MNNKNEYKAIDLFDKVLEFIAMTPDKSQWSMTALKSNPPRQIRLKQIESLSNAFFAIDSKTNLIDNVKSFLSDKPTSSIQSFLSGDFIRQRETSDYAQTIIFIKEFVKTSNSHLDETKEIHLGELVFIFHELVDYKTQLRSILTFNSGVLEASSIASQFSIHLTNSISKILVDKFDNLDKSLELIINPQGLTFTEEELISRFNYPTENLDDIDLDFL
jgi:hypothetical protein